jgi:hypothetical protein
LELWLTAGGAIAVGFETKQRVTELSGIECGNTGFASGNEPLVKLGLRGVSALIETVASGDLMVVLKPRLLSRPETVAVARAPIREKLWRESEGAFSWIKDVAISSDESRVVQFEPWMSIGDSGRNQQASTDPAV